ncbi:aminotransferase class I/II-fold pyridoxal phosphate-dependent enzyme [Candidatus Parcubacteria bacterium]|nr:aminotransferase class I/II-fold pyridoxal phosphate-dependent enzyme [Candidatus Parcubacteria bacterium]
MSNKLALFGGRSIEDDHKSLRIDWPIVGKDDYAAVKKTFKENDFCGRDSRRVLELEEKFSKYHNGLYSTALNSGTAALHLALVSLGIRPGDEVIIPALTFVATAMSVIHNQSIPIFADIDAKTYNILPESIEKNITKKTKAVIVVHMHGLPADMGQIIKICKKYNLKLIEDVAQAPGATYHSKKVGTFGDAAAFSLMSQKNLATCGECGMLLNKKLEDKNKAAMARIYGEIIKSKTERVYNSFTLGWNYTLNPL